MMRRIVEERKGENDEIFISRCSWERKDRKLDGRTIKPGEKEERGSQVTVGVNSEPKKWMNWKTKGHHEKKKVGQKRVIWRAPVLAKPEGGKTELVEGEGGNCQKKTSESRR